MGLKGRLGPGVVNAASRFMLDPLMRTVRFRALGTEHLERYRSGAGPVLFVLWHGRLLPLSYLHRGEGLATLVSASRDGDYITRTVERWGYRVVRGSSSRRGAEAFRRLLLEAEAGRSIAVTPDGPRGPRERMKTGPIVLAQRAGLPIIPAAAGCDRAWWPGSWDRMLVPKPFAAVRVAYGAPLVAPPSASSEQIESLAALVERRLAELLERVDGGDDFHG